MNLHPDLWQWPQWAYVVMMLIGLLVHILLHNKPMENSKGEPLKYNGWVRGLTVLLWYYVLSQGGFFK